MFSHYSPYSVDWQNPVNWSDGLNRGLRARWIVAPHLSGGTRWHELVAGRYGTLTSMDPPNDWQKKTSATFKGDGGNWGQLDFDGTNDYVAFGDSSTFNAPTQLTISMRVRPTSTLELVSIIGKYVSSPENGWMIESGTAGFGGNDGILIVAANAGSHYGYASSILTLADWMDLVYVFDGNQSTNATRLRFYKDGKEVALSYNGTIPSSIGSTSVAPRIGANNDGRYFAGQISDIMIWDRPLTPNEVKALHDDNHDFSRRTLRRWQRRFFGLDATSTLFRRTLMNRTGSRGAIV